MSVIDKIRARVNPFTCAVKECPRRVPVEGFVCKSHYRNPRLKEVKSVAHKKFSRKYRAGLAKGHKDRRRTYVKDRYGDFRQKRIST